MQFGVQVRELKRMVRSTPLTIRQLLEAAPSCRQQLVCERRETTSIQRLTSREHLGTQLRADLGVLQQTRKPKLSGIAALKRLAR